MSWVDFLNETGYRAVFVDLGIPEIFRREHHAQIARVMETSEQFEKISVPESEVGSSRDYAIYVRKIPLPTDSR